MQRKKRKEKLYLDIIQCKVILPFFFYKIVLILNLFKIFFFWYIYYTIVENSTTIYLSNYLTSLLNNTALLSVPSNFKLSLRSFHYKTYVILKAHSAMEMVVWKNGQCGVIKRMEVYIWYSWFRKCLDIHSHMYLLINGNEPRLALSSTDNCECGPIL